MPRPSKGARLWLRPERRKDGRLVAPATWLILDGGRQHSTGCAKGEIAAAEKRLAEHISSKHVATRATRSADQITVADVLSIFIDDHRDRQANKSAFDGRIARLNDWWGAKPLSAIGQRTCADYAASRGSPGGARRDLEDLRAAVRYHAKKGYHREVIDVELPDKGEARDRWLTRSEVARLLWTCWRYREQQRRHRGPDKGLTLPTDKQPLRHIARFILIGLYTGTRAGAIATASPVKAEGRSWVDLDAGIFYRLARGKKATNKRQPPVPLPPRLLAHMRRWRRVDPGMQHFVEWRRRPVLSVKTGFSRAVALAELDGNVTPHTLRHTAATWLMLQGVPIWEAAGFLGMSTQMLTIVYAHHDPQHLRFAADAIGRQRKPVQSLVISLEGGRGRDTPHA